MPAPETANRFQELTLTEELVLLAPDDQTGEQPDLPPDALGYAWPVRSFSTCRSRGALTPICNN